MTQSAPYTRQFALEATGLTTQTLRHWRRVLPPLRDRSAHRPCFSAGDILALKVVDGWVRVLGAKVSRLEPSAKALFELCSKEPWPLIEQSWVFCDLECNEWRLLDTSRSIPVVKTAAVILPIGDYAIELREHMMGGRNNQQALGFPLMDVVGVNGQRNKGGAR